MKNILIKIGLGIAAFFSAIFYVLFQMKKDEKQMEELERMQKKVEQMEASKQKTEALNQKLNEEQTGHDELLQEAISDDSLDSFNASIDLLHKLQEESRNRPR